MADSSPARPQLEQVIGRKKDYDFPFPPFAIRPGIGYNTSMNKSLSIFARALATENISFVFDNNAETASFDVKNRHLTLPVWNVSETVQTMLVAHEISHALWTPYERSEALLNDAEKDGYNRNLLQRIANVVEDVRIEKLMKAKYPGTRRDFFLGYKEIYEVDLFGFKGKDFTDSNTITRLNLHCKWGIPGFLTIDLSNEERGFVADIDAAQTIEDVYEVAKRIYDCKGMDKTRQKMEEQESEQTSGKSKVKADLSGDIVEGNTDKIAKKGGEDYNFPTVVISPLKNYRGSIIDSTRIYEDLKEVNAAYPDPLPAYREFVNESDAFVRQLVMQFERRKAADEIRRERPKQTGMLNLDRLHQYRTHDDIFISKIVKQDGKSHGIVFMLDFSGSMQSNLRDCYLQILQLVWFCEKAKIPFEVFAFTDTHIRNLIPTYDADEKAYYADRRNHGTSFVHPMLPTPVQAKPNQMSYGYAALMQIASSQDSPEKREAILAHLYGAIVSQTHLRSRYLSMSGTPTVESLAICSQFMQDWIKANDIQIPTLMVVTDGSPNGVYMTHDSDNTLYYGLSKQGTLTVVNEIMGTTHQIDNTSVQHLDMGNAVIYPMLDALRTNLNARIVGMYVGGQTLSESAFTQFCMGAQERMVYWNQSYNNRTDLSETPRFKAAKEAYSDGAIVVHPDSFPGYDAYFLLKTPKIVKDGDAFKDGNFTKVKNAFIKTMARRGGSRVFLTRYVDIVAGQPLHKKGDAIYNHPIM